MVNGNTNIAVPWLVKPINAESFVLANCKGQAVVIILESCCKNVKGAIGSIGEFVGDDNLSSFADHENGARFFVAKTGKVFKCILFDLI